MVGVVHIGAMAWND